MSALAPNELRWSLIRSERRETYPTHVRWHPATRPVALPTPKTPVRVAPLRSVGRCAAFVPCPSVEPVRLSDDGLTRRKVEICGAICQDSAILHRAICGGQGLFPGQGLAYQECGFLERVVWGHTCAEGASPGLQWPGLVTGWTRGARRCFGDARPRDTGAAPSPYLDLPPTPTGAVPTSRAYGTCGAPRRRGPARGARTADVVRRRSRGERLGAPDGPTDSGGAPGAPPWLWCAFHGGRGPP